MVQSIKEKLDSAAKKGNEKSEFNKLWDELEKLKKIITKKDID